MSFAATHNGYITVRSARTGDHRTFRIRTQKDDAKFAPGKRIVALLTGPDREDYQNWQQFAFVTDGRVKVWRSKSNPAEPTQFDHFARILNNQEHYEENGLAEFMTEGTCRRCNRELTVPESIKSGIGPVCAGKV